MKTLCGLIGILACAMSVSFTGVVAAQQSAGAAAKLPVRYEELTAPDFIKAVEKSGMTCIIPIGILEKHGPHLPLGTDLLDCREVSVRAAEKEYTIIYPQYYFGQIYEAKHQPGTIAYSPQLVWNMLQETCDELARNGIKKIILVNGHGGNNSFLPYFCQAQLASRKDYVVVWFRPADDPEVEKKVNALRKTTTGGHADESETSTMLVHRPDLVHVDRGRDQSGEDLNRLGLIPYAYMGIWWYAKYPNHYAGDGSHADRAIGELLINSEVDQLVKLIRVLKTDDSILKLQNQFFDGSEQPLKTKQ
ncbi:creatininase family protein [bacterium]|nr:creatininase family protein [bacterium]